MRYLSTRHGTDPVSFSEGLATGLAADGGLLVPETLPALEPSRFRGCETLPEVATRLLEPFVEDDPLEVALPEICSEALDLPAPILPFAGPGDLALELFHGPSAAFKDFGARFLAACLEHIPQRATRVVLVATSGDTGAAVASAFLRRPGVRVVVLYPDGLVSPRQAHHLGAFGHNVDAYRVDGTFDDCQALVKRAFSDEPLRRRVELVSANSISLGRLLPQMAYYAHAALAYRRVHRSRLSFVVPTGNLGNAFAAIQARAAGLPIGTVALACNANRTVPEFLDEDTYRPRASVATIANAMDVGAPSNIERLIALLPDKVSRIDLEARSYDDDAIRESIADDWSDYARAWCPHSATAARFRRELRAEGFQDPLAVVATAHPAKFEQVVEPIVGRRLAEPPGLAALTAAPSRAEPLPADYATLVERLSLAGR